jgi:hypothetical protein
MKKVASRGIFFLLETHHELEAICDTRKKPRDTSTLVNEWIHVPAMLRFCVQVEQANLDAP